MKRFVLFSTLIILPFLSSCHTIENDGVENTYQGYSIGVTNIDGTGFKMIAEGVNAQVTPDSRKIIFINTHKGIYSIGIDGKGLSPIYLEMDLYDFRLSPDGKKIAFASDSSRAIYLINTDGSGLIPIYKSKSLKNILYFSNDGSRIYFTELETPSSENMDLSSVDITGIYKILASNPASSGFGGDPQVTPDGLNIIYFKSTGNSSSLVLRNLTTQKDIILTQCDNPADAAVKPAKFISQSTFLYAFNHTLYSYNLLSGEKKSYITLPNSYYFYSQNGLKVVYRIEPGKIEMADIEGTAKAMANVPASAEAAGPYHISPDNQKILFSTANAIDF